MVTCFSLAQQRLWLEPHRGGEAGGEGPASSLSASGDQAPLLLAVDGEGALTRLGRGSKDRMAALTEFMSASGSPQKGL